MPVNTKMFSPGCALMLYKPDTAHKIHAFLNKNVGEMEMLMTCCQHDPELKQAAQIINICPGCDKRFRSGYDKVSTISLWEVLADSDLFPFPDYHKQEMTIIDACPTREQIKVHQAIRKLLTRMNINLVEPKNTGTRSTCCGDSFYGEIPTGKVKGLMIKKASEMPVNEIIVYCVSCSKSVFIGGKRPRYLVDLLFNEPTIPGTVEPDEWHGELRAYIEKH